MGGRRGERVGRRTRVGGTEERGNSGSERGDKS